MTAAFSGLFRELMMTKPKPSFSLRLMTTSLVCTAHPSVREATTWTAVGAATEAEATGAEAASLRGELCCVDTEPGLRPFTGQGSPDRRRDQSHRLFCSTTTDLFIEKTKRAQIWRYSKQTGAAAAEKVWVRRTRRSRRHVALVQLVFFNLMPVKCAACSPILIRA